MSGKPVTKTPETPDTVTAANKGGRPRKAAPLSAAERQRRSRAAKARARPVTDAGEVFRSIVESRNLTTAVDRALAQAVTDALVAGDLTEAVRALALLPPVTRPEAASSPSAEALDAKAHMMGLILSAIEGERALRARRVTTGTATGRDRLLVAVDAIDDAEERGEPAIPIATEPVVAAPLPAVCESAPTRR